MAGWLQDLRQALRLWRSRPGFTAVVLATLALGIGANTAIFSVVHQALLAPLPFPQPDRLVAIYSQFPTMGFAKFWVSEPEYLEISRWSRSYQSVGAYRVTAVNLGGREAEPQRVVSAVATASLLAALSPQPVLGRLFQPEEDVPGAEPVVLLGEAVWRRAFGADANLVGKTIDVDGVARTVVGILPASADLEDAGIEAWVPLALDLANLRGRGGHYLYLVGRLKPEVGVAAAQLEMKGLLARWHDELPDTHVPNEKTHPMVVRALKDDLVGASRARLWLLMGAVALVLTIACVNVGNLLLARAESRRREVAVRTALGAGGARLARQFLTESLLLALAGGALGLLLARFGVNALLAVFPGSVVRVEAVTLNGPVLAFSLAVSLLAGAAFGLAPGLHARTRSFFALLKEGVRGARGAGRQRVRQGLVVVQVALATTIVLAAGLLVRSFQALERVDPGFDPEGVLSFELALRGERYAEPQEVRALFQSVLDRFETLPGVVAVATAEGLPPVRNVDANDTDFEGVPQPPAGPLHNVDYYQTVAGDYLATMRVPLVAGRWFEAADGASEDRVVVVNQRLVEVFWPQQNPLGRRLRPSFGDDTPWFRVVGVVGDVKQGGLKAPVGTEVYFSADQLAQLGDAGGRRYVLARTSGDPAQLAASIRAEVARLDPTLPVAGLRAFDEVMRASTADSRLLTVLLGGFGLLALALAALGTYGVLAFQVEEQRAELGLRLALGARAETLLATVLRRGLALVGVGLGLGLALAWAARRLLEAQLFGVSAEDSLTLALTLGVLVAVAFLACLIPARRAMRIDPVETLKD